MLETFQFWKDVVTEVASEYPDVALEHMWSTTPRCSWSEAQTFDVLFTGNMFGDILSDEASMLTGSIGMLPSASLNAKPGPVRAQPRQRTRHRGQGHRQPLATILSAAMMLRFSLNQPEAADRIEAAVKKVLEQGYRTVDIWSEGTIKGRHRRDGRRGRQGTGLIRRDLPAWTR